MKSSINRINEIVSRAAENPQALGALRQVVDRAASETRDQTKLPGVIGGLITDLIDQTFIGGDPEMNDLITELRKLRDAEILLKSGAQTSTQEIARAIGFTMARLPTIRQPATVFQSRLRGLEDEIDTTLGVMAESYGGTPIGGMLRSVLPEDFQQQLQQRLRPKRAPRDAPATHRYNPETGRIEPIGGTP
jgi:hypothetical protein